MNRKPFLAHAHQLFAVFGSGMGPTLIEALIDRLDLSKAGIQLALNLRCLLAADAAMGDCAEPTITDSFRSRPDGAALDATRD